MTNILQPSVLVSTYRNKGTPWLNELVQSNPGLPLFIGCDVRQGNRKLMWRSPDVFLREWWRENRENVDTQHIWMLEHDVLVTTRLPSCAHIRGAGAKMIKKPGDKWFWMRRERDRLPPGMEPRGIVPLGVTVYHRDALDAVLDPAFDALFERNVMCEFRFASVIHHSGFPLDVIDLPDVRWHEVNPTDKPSVYHSVKSNLKSEHFAKQS